jgi:hypothetical protein
MLELEKKILDATAKLNNNLMNDNNKTIILQRNNNGTITPLSPSFSALPVATNSNFKNYCKPNDEPNNQFIKHLDSNNKSDRAQFNFSKSNAKLNQYRSVIPFCAKHYH